MRKMLVTAAVLVLAAAAAPRAESQDVAELRARLERLKAENPAAEEAARQRELRRAALRGAERPGDSLPVAAIGWGRSGNVLVGLEHQADAEAVAARVDSTLQALGLDAGAPGGLALVEADRILGHRLSATDADRLAGRTLVRFALPGGRSNNEVDAKAWQAWTVSVALTQVGGVITPPALRPWVGVLALDWNPALTSPGILRELVVSRSTLAPRCLGGEGAACAAWLGIDGDADPIRRRFPPTDARRLAPGYAGNRDPLRARQCEAGVAADCYAILVRYGPPSAASETARQSLLMYLAQRRSSAEFRAVLADTSADLGVRIARATGASPAELAAAWRSWVLETARVVPVRAGLREVFSTLLSLTLLIGLATRSGRWFA